MIRDCWISIRFVCFVFQGSLLCNLPVSGSNRLVKFASQIFLIFLILVTCKNKATSAFFLRQKIYSPSRFQMTCSKTHTKDRSYCYLGIVHILSKCKVGSDRALETCEHLVFSGIFPLRWQCRECCSIYCLLCRRIRVNYFVLV